MRIYGFDFTGDPNAAAPIACVAGLMDGGVLQVNCLASFTGLECLENFLRSDGPWVAALDFPFGQSRKLIEELGWPARWEAYVRASESLDAEAFARLLSGLRTTRGADERYLRRIDTLARARTRVRIPGSAQGRRFRRGAPLLLRCPASILPCRPNGDDRVVLEGNPALVAGRVIPGGRYKSDRPTPEAGAQRRARAALVARIADGALDQAYGVRVALEGAMAREMIEERGAASLDALLCAIQAGWAWTRRHRRWGLPERADPVEGWVCDPACAGAPPRGPSPLRVVN